MMGRLKEIMLSNPHTLRDLQLVKSLNLPNWFIAAGYIRNQVWDDLHGMKSSQAFNDVDVIYFDVGDKKEESEKKYEIQLRALDANISWSVKNQARMHIRNNEDPYSDVEDAMKRWPETATAIGITLTDQSKVQIIAPHGLDDLFQLKIRQSPYFKDQDYFNHRVERKGWLRSWPRLVVVKT